MSYQSGSSNSSATTYNNSFTDASYGTLTLKSGGDALLSGATAHGRDVIADIDGSLLVESLQDTITADSSGSGFSAGGGVGGSALTSMGGSSFGVSGGMGFGNKSGGNMLSGHMPDSISSGSAGFNTSSSYTDMAWVNQQSGITGSNSVNVRADSVHLRGASIANITEGGAEGGNLSINTNVLT